MKLLLVIGTAVGLAAVMCRSHAVAQQPGEWTRVSPFTRVEVSGDGAEVVYRGVRYELVSVEGVPTAAILVHCRNAYGERWEERFATDLIEVMAGIGKPLDRTANVVMRNKATGEVVAVEQAPMSRENREAVRRGMRDRPWERLTQADLARALDAFTTALDERWAYRSASRFDPAPMIAATLGRLAQPGGLPVGDFLLDLQRVIGRGIDGHASVDGWERFVPAGYLPFLVESSGDRFVAFRADRTALLSGERPFVEAIDGRPLADWLKAAAAFIPDGSPQYVRQHALRHLRSIQFLRKELGLPRDPTVEVLLASADGEDRRTVRVDVAAVPPAYGQWPREDHRPELPAGVAYVRVADMAADPAARALIFGALSAARQGGTRGLIVDVRDNGGGSRDVLRHLGGALMTPGDPPRVVNASAYRRHPGHRERMASRYLYPADRPGWSAAERRAIADFAARFTPEWPPPRDAFGEWHYMVLRPGDDPGLGHFDKRVVILMNAKCFSATDLLLSGLKGMRNVTLVGTASGGGSANAEGVTLAVEPLRVRLGTMVSFQADGRLFDTRGVEPDVVVEPTPEFFIGGPDDQLSRAVQIILDGG